MRFILKRKKWKIGKNVERLPGPVAGSCPVLSRKWKIQNKKKIEKKKVEKEMVDNLKSEVWYYI